MSLKSKFKFTDGSDIYNKYEKEYVNHQKGFVILGPPCSGKTTFVKNQKIKNWIDSDQIMFELGVKWHINCSNDNENKLNYLRADYILEQSKLQGLRIVGSLFWDYQADAIVILPEELNKSYFIARKKLNLDTDNQLTWNKIKEIRNFLKLKAEQCSIPIFDNCIDASNYLESKTKNI